MSAFGSYIKKVRVEKSMSLSEAGELVGCAKAHLWDLEQGKACNPTIRILAGLAVTYGESLSYLAELAAICEPGVERRTAVANFVKAKSALSPTPGAA